MATAETVQLGEPHPPKEASRVAFHDIEKELKHELIRLRHQHDKHEPEYFAAVSALSDAELVSFTADDLVEVRVGESEYGLFLFGKLRISAMPAEGPCIIQFRAIKQGADSPAKFHSFHTEEREQEGGGKTFRAVFTEGDALEWFNS